MRMVSDPETALDHDADPGQGPAFGLESSLDGPSGEDIQEFLPLSGRQAGWSSWLGPLLQRRRPMGFLSEPLGPLADGRAADIQSTSDLGPRETASAEQPARFEPPFFELFWGEFLWSPHAYHRKTGREFVKRLT
jgi:hypothetical protein